MEDKKKNGKVGKVYPRNIYEYVIKTFGHAKKEGQGTINDAPFCDENEVANVLQIFRVWHNAGYPFLTPRQKYVILARFSDLKTLDDIGNQYNLSKAIVETTLRNAIGKFRTLLYQYYSAVSIKAQNLPLDFEISLLAKGICSYTNPAYTKQMKKLGTDISKDIPADKKDTGFIPKLYQFVLKCKNSYSIADSCELKASSEEIYEALSLMVEVKFSFLSPNAGNCLYLHINDSYSEDRIASFLNKSVPDVSNMLMDSALKIWDVLEGLYNKDTSIYLVDMPSGVRKELISKGIGTTEDVATAFSEYVTAKAIVDNLKIIPNVYNNTKDLKYANADDVSMSTCKLSFDQKKACSKMGINTVQDLLSADNKVIVDIVNNSKSINPNSSPVLIRNRILDRCSSLQIDSSGLSSNAKSALIRGGYVTMKDVMLVDTKTLIRRLPSTMSSTIYNEIRVLKSKVIKEIIKKEGL